MNHSIATEADRLMRPFGVGNVKLRHRVVMAPMTRYRATDGHVPGPHSKLYYEQRASTPGTLIITEATLVSPTAGVQRNVPGIWSEEQVQAWREITEAVHCKGSFVFLQLWALGRAATQDTLYLPSMQNPIIGPSSVAIDKESPVPKEMTEHDVQKAIGEFAKAASNAMKAGFDGVEVHGANGYLVDQFFQDMTNKRTDRWGGSIENRARFGLEIMKAIIDAVDDPTRATMRLSPWSNGRNMGMPDPVPQFSYIIQQLKQMGIGCLHIIEARTEGTSGADAVYRAHTRENDEFVRLWGAENSSPLILSGGYDTVKAQKMLNMYHNYNIVISFGRLFLSNPDLPFRLKNRLRLNPYNRSTFYQPNSGTGYTDYPFSEEWSAFRNHS